MRLIDTDFQSEYGCSDFVKGTVETLCLLINPNDAGGAHCGRTFF